MKNKVTTVLLAALTGTMLPFAAQAQTPLLNDIDYTDVWWNPQRSGWGMNLVQQQNAAYVSLHDYKTDGTPTWYVAPLTRRAGGSFTGEIYRHASAPISAPLTTSQVSGTPVGNFVFTPTSPTWGTIVYTIDGQQDEQTVTRFTFVSEPFEINPDTWDALLTRWQHSDSWDNRLTLWQTSCSDPELNNNSATPTLFKGVDHASTPYFRQAWDTSMTMGLTLGDSNCLLSGTVITEGRFGRLDNAYLSCSPNPLSMTTTWIPAQVTLESSPSRLEIRWTTDKASPITFLLDSQKEACSQKGKAVFVDYSD